ncbi:hypothetical protein SBRY_110221 [Actinacidiphila bryophytorum]|uniref:Uncharacterized protein n=1 Tax=Actinacidiphila bryophytorum TaxID=1436133 RepID=A0A9W4E849_9ACTN|nr:hypothetical protein SBRY_110221 [Actinacidiphila bryophytorum]
MVLPPGQPAQGQARLPYRADRLGGRHGAGPRPAGRAEDDGRRRPRTGHQRPVQGLRHPDLGQVRVRGDDVAGHVRGRLADHAHPGAADHRPGPAAGLRGRDDVRVDPLRDLVHLPGAGLHHPRHHVLDHGRRRDPQGQGGPLGRGQEHRRGLVHHHAGRGPGRRRLLLHRQADLRLTGRGPAEGRAPERIRPRPPGKGSGACALRWHRHAAPHGGPGYPKRPEM